MDERFTLLRQAPESALKQIGAGRLRGKSDINPQWKIEAMTEVYGICGEGWYHELHSSEQVTLADGQIMLFMQVYVYIKDKEGNWSRPIVGFGGDYIYKKENNGFHSNDEAYKMCYTDALGNALKNVGVANDIYRGMWDGSKYNRNTDTALVTKASPVKKENGEVFVLSARSGQYVNIKSLNLQQLNAIVNNSTFAEAHNEIRELMSHMNPNG